MSTRPHVLVIGLDGVPLDLITTWADQGLLPTLSALMETGAFGNLRSTTPPTSGPSWSSFMTGKRPGKTGVFDFLYRVPGTYDFAPISTWQRKGAALWSILSQAGKQVGILNVPVSYPVETVNGFIISGFMTPYTATDFVYPEGLLGEMKQDLGNYRIYPTATFSDGSADAFFEASRQLLEMRTRTAMWLMDHRPWDFFMTVFFDTDRILHQLWHYLDPTHPWRTGDREQDLSQPVLAYFQHLDRMIGQLVDKAGKDTNVIVLSDHGMGAAHNFIILNNWLAEMGLLHFKHDPITVLKRAAFNAGFTLRQVHEVVNALGLARHAEYRALYSADTLLKRLFLSFRNVDWSKTEAYSFGRHTGPVYVNVEGREPHGIVKPGKDYERVRQRIIDLAGELREPGTGRPIVGQVLMREDLYHGPELEHAPDLTFRPSRPTDIFFGLADFGDREIVSPVYRYSGMHRDYGLLIMNGPDVKPGTEIGDAGIWDLAPTILYLLDTAVPRDMDGQVLPPVAALEGERPVEYAEVAELTSAGGNGGPYSQDQEAELVTRLRKLGYLG